VPHNEACSSGCLYPSGIPQDSGVPFVADVA
jgi:hypothetical protein